MSATSSKQTYLIPTMTQLVRDYRNAVEYACDDPQEEKFQRERLERRWKACGHDLALLEFAIAGQEWA